MMKLTIRHKSVGMLLVAEVLSSFLFPAAESYDQVLPLAVHPTDFNFEIKY